MVLSHAWLAANESVIPLIWRLTATKQGRRDVRGRHRLVRLRYEIYALSCGQFVTEHFDQLIVSVRLL